MSVWDNLSRAALEQIVRDSYTELVTNPGFGGDALRVAELEAAQLALSRKRGDRSGLRLSMASTTGTTRTASDGDDPISRAYQAARSAGFASDLTTFIEQVTASPGLPKGLDLAHRCRLLAGDQQMVARFLEFASPKSPAKPGLSRTERILNWTERRYRVDMPAPTLAEKRDAALAELEQQRLERRIAFKQHGRLPA